jgi:hypothetical protein
VARRAWFVLPAVVAALVAVLVIQGGRYPPVTLLAFAVGIAGMAYSLRSMTLRGERRHRAATPGEELRSRLPMDLDDKIRELKALVVEALPPSEASTWLASPQSTLGGATPADVFFSQGLDATLPAIRDLQRRAGRIQGGVSLVLGRLVPEHQVELGARALNAAKAVTPGGAGAMSRSR